MPQRKVLHTSGKSPHFSAHPVTEYLWEEAANDLRFRSARATELKPSAYSHSVRKPPDQVSPDDRAT